MTAALLDTRTASGDRTILFQKVYSAEAAMPSQSSAGLAAGMSTAISQLSRSLIGDLYGALAGYEHECSFRGARAITLNQVEPRGSASMGSTRIFHFS